MQSIPRTFDFGVAPTLFLNHTDEQFSSESEIISVTGLLVFVDRVLIHLTYQLQMSR